MNGREGEDALGDGAGVGPRDSGYSVTLQMNGSSSNPLAFVLVHFLYNYSLPEEMGWGSNFVLLWFWFCWESVSSSSSWSQTQENPPTLAER